MSIYIHIFLLIYEKFLFGPLVLKKYDENQ